jgi:hypothetical protein
MAHSATFESTLRPDATRSGSVRLTKKISFPDSSKTATSRITGSKRMVR